MGNREKLLLAARECLERKGYTRTTARDLTETAGTSLAAIGYHFGSTEALLNTALHQAMEEWGDRLERMIEDAVERAPSPARRFEVAWAQITASFEADRPLWAVLAEMMVQAQHVPELRDALTASMAEGRAGLAEIFGGAAASGDPETARMVGSLCQTLLTGLMMHWLIDPERALTSGDITEALRALGLAAHGDQAP
ncbi:TetR family transcriptional regulator [Actinomadura pelletieri DSM 43383]|uniref:TetR family transcriptional regulator n=1 Tax=Actinomadura pelletieri DSM 43383 TaxID=1120940 RepID=A0A495QA60_9ACTN|nr:TetR/AcrR family transcriptional regulator [Actinomadura pelletieri]RKS68352.1 TetR family transcriptional regulator [Actinomadura pelletieri DSM 43383]